jgi:CRP-like cAMP-binding protein
MERAVRSIEEELADVPFFDGMSTETMSLLGGCARNVHFGHGDFLFRASDPAPVFYALRHGTVALETFVPARGPVLIDTIGAGEVLGWSWLFPPFRWHFDGRAVDDVRATSFDATCLREKADADPSLGYDLMRRFAQIAIERLQSTRLRLLDVYGYGSR